MCKSGPARTAIHVCWGHVVVLWRCAHAYPSILIFALCAASIRFRITASVHMPCVIMIHHHDKLGVCAVHCFAFFSSVLLCACVCEGGGRGLRSCRGPYFTAVHVPETCMM